MKKLAMPVFVAFTGVLGDALMMMKFTDSGMVITDFHFALFGLGIIMFFFGGVWSIVTAWMHKFQLDTED
jgi:hypothetical protein